MSKHTPGPWHYMAGTHSHYDSEGKAIARVYGPRGIDCSRRDANARLIAIAPEMYDYIASAASNGCADAQRLIAKAGGNDE